jgi:hypothetical protein
VLVARWRYEWGVDGRIAVGIPIANHVRGEPHDDDGYLFKTMNPEDR